MAGADARIKQGVLSGLVALFTASSYHRGMRISLSGERIYYYDIITQLGLNDVLTPVGERRPFRDKSLVERSSDPNLVSTLHCDVMGADERTNVHNNP
jgi:hypothetical protein